MKKTYSKPAMTVVDLAMESLIAASLRIDGSQSGNEQLSNKVSGGWNSDNWTADGEEK